MGGHGLTFFFEYLQCKLAHISCIYNMNYYSQIFGISGICFNENAESILQSISSIQSGISVIVYTHALMILIPLLLTSDDGKSRAALRAAPGTYRDLFPYPARRADGSVMLLVCL